MKCEFRSDCFGEFLPLHPIVMFILIKINVDECLDRPPQLGGKEEDHQA